MKFSGSFLFLLGCLISSALAHKEGLESRDVFCKFIQDERGYVCDLTNLTLHHEDDLLRFRGEQVKGLTNEDVNYLHIHDSVTHIVPSGNIFSYFTNLVKLEMKEVSVKKIDPIENCGPLELIIFSDNEITSLDAGVFIECASLEILDLSRNEIAKIHENAFSSLSVLREIDLSYNQISKLTRKTIKPMKMLRKLSIPGNMLKDLPYDLFNDMFHMSELDLSDNPLVKLDFRTFDYTIHLENVHMLGTKIKKFHPFTFKNLRRLRYLDISRNRIKILEDELLSTNSQLEELYIDACDITEIGRKFFDKLNKLTVVYANRNDCVNGVFHGDVVDIRPKFIKCFENWDRIKDNSTPHSGDEL
jgi:Leucine-rich repeat (LRR) protein